MLLGTCTFFWYSRISVNSKKRLSSKMKLNTINTKNTNKSYYYNGVSDHDTEV